jgi:hypothetical protein
MDRDHDDAMRIDVGKGIEKDVIDDAKDRSRSADAQRESNDRYREEARVLSYASQPVFQILKNRAHCRDPQSGPQVHRDDIETNEDEGWLGLLAEEFDRTTGLTPDVGRMRKRRSLGLLESAASEFWGSKGAFSYHACHEQYHQGSIS